MAESIRCGRSAARACGSCSSPMLGSAHRYRFEIVGADGHLRLKSDPMANADRGAAGQRQRRRPSRITRGPTTSGWRRRREIDPVNDRLSVYEVHPGSWRTVPEDGDRPLSWSELADPLADHVADARLHPRRAHAGGRAPVHPELGLPGHRVLRAHRPIRHARRLPGLRRHHARSGASASSSTGYRRTSPRTSGPSVASTARRCTSTPTRARASTPTGARSCSTTAATRSATSSWPTPSTGSRSSTSTGCGSTPWRRCSTSTTRARTASGYPTATAAARTSRPSSSSRRSTPSSTASSPGCG